MLEMEREKAGVFFAVFSSEIKFTQTALKKTGMNAGTS